MKRTAILVSVLALSLAACKKKEGDGASGKPTDQPADKPAAEPPPAPFTGKLTIERVLAAKNVVQPLAPWADGLARMKGALGEPTRVKGESYEWAVVEGDDCAYVTISKEDGAKYQQTGEVVGMVMSPMKVAKDGPMMNRRDCLDITGVTPGPAEDPNAAGPPADGAAVAADAFRDQAIAGRSKWKEQMVKVSGVLASSSTSTSGADSWVNVGLKAGDADAGKPVSCNFAKNAPAPTLAIGTPVVASGKVEIKEWTSMGDNSVTLEAALADCTIEAAKKTK